MGVEGFHGLNNALVIGGVERLFRRVHDAFIVPTHRLGIEIGAIVELDSLAQVEHVDLAVLEDLPRFGEVRDIIQLGINGDQAVEEIPHHHARLHTKGEVGIEAADIGFPRHPQRAAGPGLLGRDRADDPDDNEQTEEQRPTAVSFHSTPSLYACLALLRTAEGRPGQHNM
jgi:hypothetical protein